LIKLNYYLSSPPNPSIWEDEKNYLEENLDSLPSSLLPSSPLSSTYLQPKIPFSKSY